MIDRFLVWMSTGLVTAGVTAAVVAGAGVAMATDGDSNDGGGTKTSESVDSPEKKDDSGAGNTSLNGPNINGGDKQGDDPAGVEPDPGKDGIDGALTDEDAVDEDATDETTGEDLTDGTIGEDLIEEETTGANEEAGELGDELEPGLGEGVEPVETGAGSHKDVVQGGDSQIAQWTQAGIDPFGPVTTTNENDEIKEAARDQRRRRTRVRECGRLVRGSEGADGDPRAHVSGVRSARSGASQRHGHRVAAEHRARHHRDGRLRSVQPRHPGGRWPARRSRRAAR